MFIVEQRLSADPLEPGTTGLCWFFDNGAQYFGACCKIRFAVWIARVCARAFCAAGGLRDSDRAVRRVGDFVHLEHSAGRCLARNTLLPRSGLEQTRRSKGQHCNNNV